MMNRTRRSATIFLLLMGCMASTAQWALRDTGTFHQRNGLPNFFHRIEQGGVVKIGFIGGSITVAEGWRPEIISGIRDVYQVDSIFDCNAAVGGTNSKYGVFRIDEVLLSRHKFDLIFIEFAVNDGDGLSSDIERSMEGMVRKVWRSHPTTDLCFVYTVSSDALQDIAGGNMNLSASKHDSIASWYGIPSVFLGTEVYGLLQSDSVVWKSRIKGPDGLSVRPRRIAFTRDGVHPTAFGHEIYASIIKECLNSMDGDAGERLHSLTSPLFANNYEHAKMVRIDPHKNQGMEVIDRKGEREDLDLFLQDAHRLLVSEDPDDCYSFRFSGTEVGLNLIIGPAVGNMVIEADGTKYEYTVFDGYCSYWRKAALFLELPDAGEHRIKIYPSPVSLSLDEKREILNHDRRKEDLDHHPEKYSGNELIFSGIFINGEMKQDARYRQNPEKH